MPERRPVAGFAATCGTAPASTPAASAPAAPGPSAVRLGIQARILTDEESRKLNASAKQGLYVLRADKDSSADLMRMQTGDIIVEVNGSKVAGVDQLRRCWAMARM